MIIGLSATLAASGLAVIMLATGATAAAKPASAGGVHPLVFFNPIRAASVPSLCVQPATRDQFASIVLASCNGGVDQAWAFIQDGSANHYYFVNQATGFCLDAFDGADTGDRVLTNECGFLRNGETISNDEWNAGRSLPATTKIESRVHFTDTGFCVDVPFFPGAVALLFPCNGSAEQTFAIG
jgi:hypothetical protein